MREKGEREGAQEPAQIRLKKVLASPSYSLTHREEEEEEEAGSSAAGEQNSRSSDRAFLPIAG